MALLGCIMCVAKGQECNCLYPSPEETTHISGNEEILIKETKVYKQLRGKVDDSVVPIEGVLVEIFVYSKKRSFYDKTQARIMACKTDSKGKFCLNNLPRGKYLIVFSLGEGWNPTYFIVKVDPFGNNSIDDEISISLTLGT